MTKKPDPVKVRLWAVVEDAAQAVTDPVTGRFENKALVEEIRARLADEQLAADLRAATADRLAEGLANGFVNSRNPRKRKHGTLFDPQAILPLGDGKRVWMNDATDTDLIEWARLSTRNLARVATAEGDRQAYVAERLQAWRDYRDWRLGRLEHEVFGYEPVVEDIPEGYDEPEEWDEGDD
ncbi:hypothetical protein [Streptosporangium saharense]|uniref:hypothetical protein n=1 Tax=Streptosporangium saharense TaxID=1706840 RepID=UPI00342E38E5